MPVPRLRRRPLRLSGRPGSPAGLLCGPSGRWRRLLPARKNQRRLWPMNRRLLLMNRRLLRLGQCLLQRNRHLLPWGRGPKSRPIPTARQRLNRRRALQNSRCPERRESSRETPARRSPLRCPSPVPAAARRAWRGQEFRLSRQRHFPWVSAPGSGSAGALYLLTSLPSGLPAGRGTTPAGLQRFRQRLTQRFPNSRRPRGAGRRAPPTDRQAVRRRGHTASNRQALRPRCRSLPRPAAHWA